MHWFSWFFLWCWRLDLRTVSHSQPPSLIIPETDSSDEVDEVDGWTLGWKFGMIYLNLCIYYIYISIYTYIYIYIICHHIYLIDNEMIHHLSRASPWKIMNIYRNISAWSDPAEFRLRISWVMCFKSWRVNFQVQQFMHWWYPGMKRCKHTQRLPSGNLVISHSYWKLPF